MESPAEESYASTLYDTVMDIYDRAMETAKKDGQEIKIECLTEFGMVWITHLTVDSKTDLMQMDVLEDDGTRSLILTNAGHCSFRFSAFTPSETQKEMMGFGERKPKSLG